VCAALGQRDDVVNLLRWVDRATLLTPLAQWVGSNEAVTHTLPCPAVALLHSRVALVAFVPLGFPPGVLLTEATVCKPGTTGVRAGALGFAGHQGTSVGIGKGACRSLCGAPCIHFYILIISKIQGVIKRTIVNYCELAQIYF
jgi:hypothetical protein